MNSKLFGCPQSSRVPYPLDDPLNGRPPTKYQTAARHNKELKFFCRQLPPADIPLVAEHIASFSGPAKIFRGRFDIAGHVPIFCRIARYIPSPRVRPPPSEKRWRRCHFLHRLTQWLDLLFQKSPAVISCFHVLRLWR